jgi:hypothetical protein
MDSSQAVGFGHEQRLALVVREVMSHESAALVTKKDTAMANHDLA